MAMGWMTNPFSNNLDIDKVVMLQLNQRLEIKITKESKEHFYLVAIGWMGNLIYNNLDVYQVVMFIKDLK